MGLSDNIRTTYSQASKEVQKKLDAFFARHKKLAEQKLKAVEEGKISESDYQQWLLRQMFTGQRWREKLDDITRTYVDADETARQLVGDRAKNVFATFANSTARDIQSKVGGGVSFDMYDRHTVERLLRENPQMLPEWKINEKKDYRWNAQRVQNAITQGIIQGESIPQLTKRLTSELSAGSAKHMMLFARTAMTGAQNAGRVERLHEAQDMGIVVKKKWLAAHDDRVRDAHAELDGQEVGIDEPFHSSLGDIMYPGDPTADPANVYNCRCTLTYVYDVKASRENLQEQEESQGIKESPKTDIEQLRTIAERSADKYDFWTSLDEDQIAVFKASGLTLDDAFTMLHGEGEISEWKPASPGGVKNFTISHDYTGAGVSFEEIAAKTEGWMADANDAGTIHVRKGGLGDDWEFIISHEAGHQLADFDRELQRTIIDNPGNVFGRYNTRLMAFDGVYGEYNPEEAFATCVSNYVRHRADFEKRYPNAYAAVDKYFKTSPSALDFVKRIMEKYRRQFKP